MDRIANFVNKFLAWPLPQSVRPDDCVMDRDYPHRIGTNLLTATEARAMFEHCLPKMPDTGYSTEAEGDAYTHGWFDGNEADRYGLPRYRHKARGTYYTVIGEASLQTSAPLVDGARMVVYRGDDGALWVRPHAEFTDGRFEEISAGVQGVKQ